MNSPGKSGINDFPVKHPLRPYLIFSAILGVLVIAASFSGVFFSKTVFPDEELLQDYMSTDFINLFLIVPLLALCMILAVKKNLIGLLFWPGTVMMLTYHYTAYVFGTPISWFTLLYFTILAISVFLIIALFLNIDSKMVKTGLSGLVYEKLSGWVLLVFGVFIFARFYYVITEPLLRNETLAPAEISAAIADFLLCPAWIICGIFLIRKKAAGYTGAAALMFKISMLFIGLLVYFLVNPVLTGAPFSAADFITVSIMTVIFNIPFILFTRGIFKSRK